ncbi:ATP-binding protein [Streptomyces sp. NPDC049881]|uniref:ATP-binding protein n=1 Tax=Streptomyces sp. NPDC049881 TaxID=3155778 RepID=UPI0034239E90
MHAAHPGLAVSAPPRPPKVAACGFFLAIRPDGFVLHMSASREHMRRMRAHVFAAVADAGAGERVADAARLVASELVGNAVRLCGPWTPVVVQIVRRPDLVEVQVHDPEPAAMPDRRAEPPDNDGLESGRGLWILDALAPGWTVESTAVGKQVTATLPCGELASG